MGIYGYFLNVQIEKAGKNRYHNFEFRLPVGRQGFSISNLVCVVI